MNVAVSSPRPSAIDARRWPAVAKVPSGPVAAACGVVAEWLLRRAAAELPLRVAYPDGTVLGAGDATSPTLVITRPDRFARRVGRYGLIGFGESYMAGEWDCDDLCGLLTVFATAVSDLVPSPLQSLRPIAHAVQPRPRRNNRGQARRNVAAHYDLSNELFAAFLDETMTYSCALFSDLPASWSDLPEAQRRKIDRLLDAAGVRNGSRVLEIGTGWGELCIRAAARGAHVRSVTLSAQQQRLASQRVCAAGLSRQVHIDLCDYRDVTGSYDAVVSAEMIEAIGYRWWPHFFRALERLVKPGGRVAIQTITMPHARMMATRKTHTWMQKYIFPGGLIPSAEAILGIAARHTTLRPVDLLPMRPHYAETLRLWRERFSQRRDRLAGSGFDDVFARMWELYLAYSEAGFRSGYLNVYQWTFVREHRP